MDADEAVDLLNEKLQVTARAWGLPWATVDRYAEPHRERVRAGQVHPDQAVAEILTDFKSLRQAGAGRSPSKADRGRRRSSPWPPFTTPACQLRAAELTRAVGDLIQAVRQEVFTSPSVPFEDLDAAWRWVCDTKERYPGLPRVIETYARADLAVHREDAVAAWDAFSNSLNQANSIAARHRLPVRAVEERHILRFPDRPRPVAVSEVTRGMPRRLVPKAWRRKKTIDLPADPQRWVDVPVIEDSPLAALERVSREISEGTYLTRQSVVGYILAGTEPVLPALALRAESPVPLPREKGVGLGRPRIRRVVVEFYAPPAQAQLRSMQSVLAHALGGDRRRPKKGQRAPRPITEKDRRLLELVQKLKGEPADGPRGRRMEFWTAVLNKWNASVPRDERYRDDWRLPRKAYYRLLARLQRVSGA